MFQVAEVGLQPLQYATEICTMTESLLPFAEGDKMSIRGQGT
jgi:hypothetical protein